MTTQAIAPAQDEAWLELLLAPYPARVEYPVAWGDMDAFGHVNNVVHIRWLENGRVSYLESAGITRILSTQGVGPILATIHCRYKAPVVYPDSVVIGTRVSELGEDHLTFDHRIVSRALRTVVAEGYGQMVSYDYVQRRRAPFPPEVRAAIEALEATVP